MHVLIVEDERVAARGLERLLRELLAPRVESVKVQATLTASECFLLDHPVDLLLLDLNLGGEDGFELLRAAAAQPFQTIVVSANTERAIEAFSFGVLDFVPKPVSKERLAQALNRLDRAGEVRGGYAKYLAVRGEEAVVLVPTEEILYLEAQDNHVLIHKKDDHTERHRKTLDSLEKVLPPQFARIHRSYVVDLGQVDELRSFPGGRYEMLLRSGDVLPVGRSRYRHLKERLS